MCAAVVKTAQLTCAPAALGKMTARAFAAGLSCMWGAKKAHMAATTIINPDQAECQCQPTWGRLLGSRTSNLTSENVWSRSSRQSFSFLCPPLFYFFACWQLCDFCNKSLIKIKLANRVKQVIYGILHIYIIFLKLVCAQETYAEG